MRRSYLHKLVAAQDDLIVNTDPRSEARWAASSSGDKAAADVLGGSAAASKTTTQREG